MTDLGPDIDRERLNMRAVETALAEAGRIRSQLIEFGHAAIVAFAQKDQIVERAIDEGHVAANDIVVTFVREDLVAALGQDKEPVRAFSLLLNRDAEIGQAGHDKLRIYMPVPIDVAEGRIFDPEKLPTPDSLYIEETTEDGKVVRHAVTKSQLFEYESAHDTEIEVIKDDLHPDRIWKLLSVRLDSGLPYLTRLYEDLVNMKVVPQFEGPPKSR